MWCTLLVVRHILQCSLIVSTTEQLFVSAQFGTEVANGMVFCIWTREIIHIFIVILEEGWFVAIATVTTTLRRIWFSPSKPIARVQCVVQFKCFRRCCQFRCVHFFCRRRFAISQYCRIVSLKFIFSPSSELNGYRRLLTPVLLCVFIRLGWL